MRLFGPKFLRDKAGDGSSGGGGGSGDGKGVDDLKAQLDAMKSENEKIKVELESFKSKKSADDADLQKKAEDAKKAEEEKKNLTRRQESAVKFNLTVQNFVKDNKDILPAEVEDIVKQAEKENFDTAAQKSAAVKVGIISSFFKVKENYDRLTASQRTSIDRYLNLTKNGKEEEAENIFENVFEPALELVKAHKKAEEVSKARSGQANSSTGEIEYKNRLMEHSKKALMGGKS
jgi:hypothetical protein